MNTLDSLGPTIEVQVGDKTVEIPTGARLVSNARRFYPATIHSESEAVTRYIARTLGMDEKNHEARTAGTKLVLDTILGGEDLGRIKVERFLTNDGARPLFSPIVEEGIRLGLNRVAAQWEDLIAQTVPVDGMTYAYYEFNNGDASSGVGADATGTEEFKLRRIAQGGPVPTARVTIGEQSIQLWKMGRGIEWTDEAKMAPIDMASLWFQQVGLQIGWDYHEQAIEMLLNGYFADGSDDAPVLATGAPGVIDFADLLTAVGTMQTTYGYTADVMIMSLARSVSIRTMETGAGNLVFPNGTTGAGLPPIRLAVSVPDDKIIFADTGFALVRFVNKEFGTEFERSVITGVEGSYGTSMDLTIPFFKRARLILDS
jgi:hypothetical protein